MRHHRSLAAALLAAAALPAGAQDALLGEVTVTGTREGELLEETPASIGIIDETTIEQDNPTHPAQIMSQVPGVRVGVTNGEGHTTSIRQPLSTAPVYLFLEDGIPTRSTGFFNHNALYEINLPGAGGLEVVRGPGTALYGSDAIGGVINVLTRMPPLEREFGLTAELGGHGWWRLLPSAGDTVGDDGWRADLNLTHTDGWRDTTAYDRQSGNLRWDHAIGGAALVKTVFAFSQVDQETGANAPLVRADYEDSPRRNYHAIAYREVSAYRLSSAYEHESGDTLLSVTPYVRHNHMELLPSFALSYDPTLYTTENQSFGLLTKWRKDLPWKRARLIAGLDIDYSPGGREENSIDVTVSGTGASRIYSDYSLGARVYDYDVDFLGTSPYLHGEFSPTERTRVSAGLRYDHLRYDYDNGLADSAIGVSPTRFYGHAADAERSYSHLSPKIGITYALREDTHLFAAYNRAFRAPSESQLFRPSTGTTAALAQANAQSALGLDPVKADQIEVGMRGNLRRFDYELSVYQLTKKDDILSYRDPVTNVTQSTNAGETSHRGVELGLGRALTDQLRIDVAFSYAEHFYEEWVVSGSTDYSGNEMEAAPRRIANTRLTWLPVEGTRVQVEWLNLGSYWMDQANSARYKGHDVYNLRGNWAMTPGLSLYATLHNLLDDRYAESASVSSGTEVFSPGLPRTLYVGVEAKW